MVVRANGYFNSPQFAQAAANLGALFAPPSGGDAAGWAAANAKKEEASRLAQLFAAGATPSEQAALVGVQNYGATPQGFTYNVDQDNLTARRGQDVAASTSITNNQLTNRTSLLGDLYSPLSQGQIRPELPGEIAGAYGMPAVTVPGVAGAVKPLGESELKAAILGQMSPELQQAAAFGSTPVETIVTPEGQPQIQTRLGAVGQTPFINRGAEAKPDLLNYRTPDGRVGTAVYDGARGGLVDTQDGTVLPSGVQTFKSQAQGTSDEILGKTTANRVDQQLIDIANAKNTAVKLRDMIATSPASQGAVGMLRGATQNLIATGNELGTYLGGNADAIQQRIANGLEGEDLAGAFDKNIPAIEMMANLLAFQYAKTTTGERLSNEMLNQTRRALGLEGLMANQQSSLARLEQAIKLIEDQEKLLDSARQGGVGAVRTQAPPAPAATGMTAPTASGAPAARPVTTRRYNPATGTIE